MPDIKVTTEEAAVLKAVLARLAIRSRTGEVGIVHGMDRFISSQLILKRGERELLAVLAAKVGLPAISEAP
jgi:hypothetical protein